MELKLFPQSMCAIAHDIMVKYPSEILTCEAMKVNVSSAGFVFTYGLMLCFSF